MKLNITELTEKIGNNRKNNIPSFNFSIDYFTQCGYEIDDTVKLDSDKTLQRDYCWEPFQERELIYSILKGINIPPIYILSDEKIKKYYIIDGKQRLNTVSKFVNNEFSIMVDGNEFFFKDFDDTCKSYFKRNNWEVFIRYVDDLQDFKKDIIDWFLLINFSGSQIDLKHKNELLKIKKDAK